MKLNAWGLISILFLPCMTGCRPNTSVSAPGRIEALRVSDAFMSDLIADHIDAAADKMGPKFIAAAGGKSQAEGKIRELLNYCGRPLESELRHEETGVWVYADGRSPAPLRMFVYSGKTSQNPKGVCFFSVRVVAGKDAAELINFGPLKLTSGELPEWAR
jgi:hypothetical protein